MDVVKEKQPLVFDASTVKQEPKQTGRLVFQFDDGEVTEITKINDDNDAVLSLSTRNENAPDKIEFKSVDGKVFRLFIEYI